MTEIHSLFVTGSAMYHTSELRHSLNQFLPRHKENPITTQPHQNTNSNFLQKPASSHLTIPTPHPAECDYKSSMQPPTISGTVM